MEKIYLQIDAETNLVIGYSCAESIDNEAFYFIPYEVDEKDVEFIEQNFENLTIKDGKLVLIDEPEVFREQKKKERKIMHLRIKRAGLFKEHLDRSPFWYRKNVDPYEDRQKELEEWYETWCDMPELVMKGEWVEPEMPEFLIK